MSVRIIAVKACGFSGCKFQTSALSEVLALALMLEHIEYVHGGGADAEPAA